MTGLRRILDYAERGEVPPDVEFERCLRELAAEVYRCRSGARPALSDVEAAELRELARSDRISVTQRIALRSILVWTGVLRSTDCELPSPRRGRLS